MYNKLFEKWVENFLIEKLLEVLCVKGNEMNYCDLCKCMNEKVMVIDWCKECMELLCCVCVKVYGRSCIS